MLFPYSVGLTALAKLHLQKILVNDFLIDFSSLIPCVSIFSSQEKHPIFRSLAVQLSRGCVHDEEAMETIDFC